MFSIITLIKRMRQTYRHTCMYRPLLERLYIRKRHRRTSRQTDGQISALRCSAICMPNWTAENAMDRKSQMPNNFRSNDFALSVYLPVRPFICLPVYIYDYLYVCLSVCLLMSVYYTVYGPVANMSGLWTSICLPIHSYVYM